MTKHKHQAKSVAYTPWLLLALALLSGIVCIFALRANNQRMIVLREAVYTADRENKDVQQPLRELQAYVTSHMNTNLSAGPNAVYPPIQLKYTYERLVQERAVAASAANSKLYSDAQAYCEQQNPNGFSGGNRIPCIQQYVQSRTTQAAAPIPDALYKFSFVSPRWSADLAGLSLLFAVVCGLGFVVALLVRWWIRQASK